MQKSLGKIDFLPIFSPILQVLSMMLDGGGAGGWIGGSLIRAWERVVSRLRAVSIPAFTISGPSPSEALSIGKLLFVE